MLPILKALRLGLVIAGLAVLSVLTWGVVVIYSEGMTLAAPGLAAVNAHGLIYVQPLVARAYNASGIIAWVVTVLMIALSTMISQLERRR
jgi:hypothetical protein